MLLTVFKESWPKVRQRTPVASEVLNDANDRAEELLEAVAPLKERAPATAREAGERRRRASALLARAYLVSVGRRRVL